MASKSSSPLSGVLFALAGFSLFSIHDVIVKALGATYSPIQIVFFSALLGLPLALIMLMQDKTDGTLRPHHPGWIAIRTVATIVTGLSAFYAFSVLPIAQVYAIFFAMPLLITILSIPILGETVRMRRWIAVIVGLIGVIIVLRPGSAPIGPGHLAAIVAAFGGATASVIVRKIGAEERSLVMLLYPMAGNILVMGALLPLIYKPMPLEDFAGVTAIAIFAFAAMLCIIAAYRRAEAVLVAPMQYVQLLWAVVLGGLFFGEIPDRWTFVGAAVIIASGLYIVLREARASKLQPVLENRSRAETGTYPRTGSFLKRDDDPRT